jgi:hypothetical protein
VKGFSPKRACESGASPRSTIALPSPRADLIGSG